MIEWTLLLRKKMDRDTPLMILRSISQITYMIRFNNLHFSFKLNVGFTTKSSKDYKKYKYIVNKML